MFGNKQGTVKLVGTGFGGDQDSWPPAGSIFRGIVEGQHLELLDRVDGRKNCNGARRKFVIVGTVEQPIGCVLARAAYRQRITAADRCLISGSSVELAEGIRRLSGRRRQCGKLYEVTTVERQVCHLVGRDNLAQGWIGGIHRTG